MILFKLIILIKIGRDQGNGREGWKGCDVFEMFCSFSGYDVAAAPSLPVDAALSFTTFLSSIFFLLQSNPTNLF